MTRVAVLGAGGFIGNRTVEMLHRGGRRNIVPVVRRPSSLALAARFALQGRVAEAMDETAMTMALTGCDVVVTAVAGPPSTITGICAPLVRAAKAAGVRRIVHLSSQMVHGQALSPGTTEDSPLPRRQMLPYNRAKAAAERILQSLAASAGVELATLRPGIVYGPRSRWTGGIADELLAGEAFLIRDVDAVCNAIYVDNLVHAIDLALDTPDVTGQAFFVNDAEPLHWADLIEPLADALGVAPIPRPALSEALTSGPSWTEDRLLPLAKHAFRKLPRRVSHVLLAARRAATQHGAPAGPPPRLSREMALLQSNGVRLSDERARRMLGYHPPVAHAEAMCRSIAWLRFAGYPVQ